MVTHQPQQRMGVEEAQKVYDAHSPSMTTHICLGCFGQVPWPCKLYREARDTLILSGRIQDGPLRPSV